MPSGILMSSGDGNAYSSAYSPFTLNGVYAKLVSGLSRESRTSYRFYPNTLILAGTRRRRGTESPCAILRMTSGMS